MPNLRQHMYRVTAVGLYLLDHWCGPQIDRHLITQTLLLHDMANIIKFDLKGQPRWQKVQQDFIGRYGTDEYAATAKIAAELNLPARVIYLINHRNSPNLKQVVASYDWELKLASYADFRVAPHGVVSVTARFDDMKQRYQGKTHIIAQKGFITIAKNYCLKLESQLQPLISIPLDSITDQTIAPYLKSLPSYRLTPEFTC